MVPLMNRRMPSFSAVTLKLMSSASLHPESLN